jgi:hypothetical protein
MKAKIYINRHIINRNKKTGTDQPPITIRTSKGILKARRVDFKEGSVVYRPDNPLSCGATVWIEVQDFDTLTIDGLSANAQQFSRES